MLTTLTSKALLEKKFLLQKLPPNQESLDCQFNTRLTELFLHVDAPIDILDLDGLVGIMLEHYVRILDLHAMPL